MTDEKRYTERDLIRAKREGARKMAARCIITEGGLLPLYKMCNIELDQEIAQMYPLPKVTRPRVVAGLRAQYKVVDGVVHGRSNASFDWRVSASIHVDDVVRVANLLANPTETVDE